MLSQLALFSQGLLSCHGERWRRGEGNIRFPLPVLDVTTLIIDLGKEQQQLGSFGIFLEYERLIYFFNQGDRCQLGSGKKDTESCLKLSQGDILSRLRCETSICEF